MPFHHALIRGCSLAVLGSLAIAAGLCPTGSAALPSSQRTEPAGTLTFGHAVRGRSTAEPILTPAEASLQAALADLVADDCDTNGLPAECDADCNTNGAPDDLDIFRSVSLDCNSNRLPDECDVSSGESRDCNANQVPDECEGIPRADLDCDGDVDSGDLAVFRSCHPLPGRPVPAGCDFSDLNRDDRVDCADWRILRDAWTTGTPPGYPRCRTALGITPSGEE